MKIAFGVLVVAAAVLAGGLTASSATASRKPTAKERTAIAQAVGVPRRCLRMRVATVRKGWARVALRAPLPASCQEYAADGILVMRRRDGIWRQRFAGSSWSCPIPTVPEKVRKDLKLGCPEGGP